MSNFQPPPTWALPIIVDEKTGKAQFNPIWLKWFVDLSGVLTNVGASGTGGGASGGNINHNLLGNLQGGQSPNQYFHLSQTQYDNLNSGGSGGDAFPVDAIFVSVSPVNPATSLGYGTWTAFGAGRVLVGVDGSDPDFNTVEETGGSKSATFPQCC